MSRKVGSHPKIWKIRECHKETIIWNVQAFLTFLPEDAPRVLGPAPAAHLMKPEGLAGLRGRCSGGIPTSTAAAPAAAPISTISMLAGGGGGAPGTGGGGGGGGGAASIGGIGG